MTKVRFFFSVFFVIQLFICSSKISYAEPSPAGATDGSTDIQEVRVTPGVKEVTIASNVKITTPTPAYSQCEYGSVRFCSWQSIDIKGEGNFGWVNVAFNAIYKVAKITATAPSGKVYPIEVFLVDPGNIQQTVKFNIMYTEAHWQDGLSRKTFMDGSVFFHTPRNRDAYGTVGQFIPDPALNKNDSSKVKWWTNKCPLYKCVLDLAMGFDRSPSYDIRVILPDGFNESELRFNQAAEVLELAAVTRLNWDEINDNGNGGVARYYVSGTIKFPQTCAFSLSKSEITFGSVEAKYENGELGNTQSVQLKSTCTSLDNNARIAYTITPYDTTPNHLEDNNTVAVLERTNSGSKALGLIFGFDSDTIDCFGSKRQYLTEHIFNPKYPANSTTTLNFKLCQYGLPQKYGEKSERLNIRIKWLKPENQN